ncbi:MAG: hypothetical protein QOI12_2870 [Alphaproteobacteria bacterium]|jgi:hypothetical protein|nr:hypothetical protein [Alphaproteobacteria bacterium]
MIARDCANCGEAVSSFAKTCAHCGAPNRAWLAAVAIAASLAVLVVAVAIAALVALRGTPPAPQAGTALPAADEEYTWLKTAMDECDAEASKTVSTLFFLVIPLASPSDDIGTWRAKSLNDIGNAILLPSDEALPALRSRMLSISTQQYLFTIRDEETNTIYKWTPSAGVKKFSTPDADAINRFTIQFQSGDKTSDAEWGAAFVRRKGNCYWVNAIIGK